jgi:hypothetical protein
VRRGITNALIGLSGAKRTDLADVGFYRERITAYARGSHVPNSVSLVVAMIKLGMTIEVTDPDGVAWTVRAERQTRQLGLPIDWLDNQ